jgi:hypothetical protein
MDSEFLLDKAIASINCIIYPQGHPYLTDEGKFRTITFDSVIKSFMICHDLLFQLGVVKSKLPNIFSSLLPPILNLLPFSKRNGQGESSIIPCIVQVTNNGKVEPPLNLYFIIHEGLLLLAKPDVHLLGQATIIYQLPFCSICIQMETELNALDIQSDKINFYLGRGTRAMVGLEGFDVIESIEKKIWKARLSFSSRKAFDRASSYIMSRSRQVLQDQIEQLKGSLS